MNEKFPYNFSELNGSKPSYSGDYLTDSNPEAKTKKNLEAIESLFDEWDDDDKNNTEEFTLNNQNNFSFDDTPKVSASSFDTEPSISFQNDDAEDPLDKTREISSVDLEELKALQAELHKIYDEPDEDEKTVEEGQSQSKGKSLVKATKQGIAFSNGSMTRTFLDCAVLCFVTASMGFGMFMYIFSQI